VQSSGYRGTGMFQDFTFEDLRFMVQKLGFRV
jgi:hypothetical protein